MKGKEQQTHQCSWSLGEWREVEVGRQELQFWKAQNYRPRTLSFMLQTCAVQHGSHQPYATIEFELWLVWTEMAAKCKIHSGFQKYSTKKKVKYLSNNFILNMFKQFRYIGLSILIETYGMFNFTFLSVATRKFKIKYVVYSMFLLGSTAMDNKKKSQQGFWIEVI